MGRRTACPGWGLLGWSGQYVSKESSFTVKKVNIWMLGKTINHESSSVHKFWDDNSLAGVPPCDSNHQFKIHRSQHTGVSKRKQMKSFKDLAIIHAYFHKVPTKFLETIAFKFLVFSQPCLKLNCSGSLATQLPVSLKPTQLTNTP